MHKLAVMHRRTLCENVDSAKIKVPFFILQISIFYAWHRCIVWSYIVSIHIDESLHPYFVVCIWINVDHLWECLQITFVGDCRVLFAIEMCDKSLKDELCV